MQENNQIKIIQEKAVALLNKSSIVKSIFDKANGGDEEALNCIIQDMSQWTEIKFGRQWEESSANIYWVIESYKNKDFSNRVVDGLKKVKMDSETATKLFYDMHSNSDFDGLAALMSFDKSKNKNGKMMRSFVKDYLNGSVTIGNVKKILNKIEEDVGGDKEELILYKKKIALMILGTSQLEINKVKASWWFEDFKDFSGDLEKSIVSMLNKTSGYEINGFKNLKAISEIIGCKEVSEKILKAATGNIWSAMRTQLNSPSKNVVSDLNKFHEFAKSINVNSDDALNSTRMNKIFLNWIWSMNDLKNSRDVRDEATKKLLHEGLFDTLFLYGGDRFLNVLKEKMKDAKRIYKLNEATDFIEGMILKKTISSPIKSIDKIVRAL